MEAEFAFSQKYYDTAARCYEGSIKAAREHKFIQEEAIASELFGIYFLDRGLLMEASTWYLNSIDCYKKWGAFAVSTSAARRIQENIQGKFDPCVLPLEPTDDDSLVSGLVEKSPSRKRQSS